MVAGRIPQTFPHAELALPGTSFMLRNVGIDKDGAMLRVLTGKVDRTRDHILPSHPSKNT